MKYKIKRKLKLKILFILCLLFGGSIVSIIFYYGFDPALLARLSFYENLGNPSMRIVRIEEGMRKEEIVQVMAEKLNWDQKDKDDFVNMHLALNTPDLEGRYFPKTYLIHKDEDPSGVTAIMFHEFATQIDKIHKPKSNEIINSDVVIKIASIIQREAGGKHDMRLISGIIWNRLFKGMKLQMDATLQYAKGSEQDGWWRRVHPEDKKIESSYNTYVNKGLPPGAIANPGIDALSAAYNPTKTECLFYLHDKKGRIHCSKTYTEHKKNVSIYY